MGAGVTALERARTRWGMTITADDIAHALGVPLPPGWWTCSECGRRADREGERGTARRWCTGERGTVHRATEMTVQR